MKYGILESIALFILRMVIPKTLWRIYAAESALHNQRVDYKGHEQYLRWRVNVLENELGIINDFNRVEKFPNYTFARGQTDQGSGAE